MGKRQLWTIIFAGVLILSMVGPLHNVQAEEGEGSKEIAMFTKKQTGIKELKVPSPAARFTYNSGLNFEYPDAVRGIYVTGPSAGGAKMAELTQLLEETELNAMVIDIKEDHGNITFEPEEGSPYEDVAESFIKNPRGMLEELEEKGIYPIARVVVFKDSLLAEKRPELSFTQNGQVWKNGKGEAFVNPFMEEVWDYNVELAKVAAEMGFEEIQFDYVRFPEGFDSRDDILEYGQGKYADMDLDNVQKTGDCRY